MIVSNKQLPVLLHITFRPGISILHGFQRADFQPHVGAVPFVVGKDRPVGILRDAGVFPEVGLQQRRLQMAGAVKVEVHAQEGQFVEHVDLPKVGVELDAVKNDGLGQQEDIAGVQVAVPIDHSSLLAALRQAGCELIQ